MPLPQWVVAVTDDRDGASAPCYVPKRDAGWLATKRGR